MRAEKDKENCGMPFSGSGCVEGRAPGARNHGNRGQRSDVLDHDPSR